MEISRLTLSKETKGKLKKDLSVREKGKILFAKLEELDNNGMLSKARNRADVARLVGYQEERAKAGYAWVSNLIRRGHLQEIISEWTPSGKMMAEYHLTGTNPDYGYEERQRRKAKKRIAQEWQRWQDKVETEQKPQPLGTQESAGVKVEISKGDMTIKLELTEVEQATNLITTIMKGE